MEKAVKSKLVTKRVTFQITAGPKSTVSPAGTFNQWDVTRHPMKDISGAYAITLMLPKGET